MTLHPFIQTEVANPGSSIYYSLLYTDEKYQENIAAVRAFYKAVQDSQFIEAKIRWWQDELLRSKDNQAQHPITQSLRISPHLYDSLNNILENFILDARTSIYETEHLLNQFYLKTAGTLEKIIGQIFGIEDEEILNNLSSLGIFIQRISNLRYLRKTLSHQKTYFSGELLLKHHTTLYDLSQYKITDNIRNLFKDETEILNNSWIPICKGMTKSLSTVILAKIQKALLKEIEKADFPILTKQISLTPLRKWWIATRSVIAAKAKEFGL